MTTIANSGIQRVMRPVTLVSAMSEWQRIYTNTRVAASATELRKPTSKTGLTWVYTAGATEMLLRTSGDKNTSSVTTSPIVRVFGVHSINGDYKGVYRLDSANWAATGVTVTQVIGTAGLQAGVYVYGPQTAAIDLLGCQAVLVLIETATVCSGGLTTPQLLVKLL
jgi:hypothetical protein